METTATPRYARDIGEALNAYVACVVARVTNRGYSAPAHAAAAQALDDLLADLSADRDALDYLSDWFSGGNEIRIVRADRSDGVRTQRNADHDVLWVNEFDDVPGVPYETVRCALRAALAAPQTGGDRA